MALIWSVLTVLGVVVDLVRRRRHARRVRRTPSAVLVAEVRRQLRSAAPGSEALIVPDEVGALSIDMIKEIAADEGLTFRGGVRPWRNAPLHLRFRAPSGAAARIVTDAIARRPTGVAVRPATPPAPVHIPDPPPQLPAGVRARRIWADLFLLVGLSTFGCLWLFDDVRVGIAIAVPATLFGIVLFQWAGEVASASSGPLSAPRHPRRGHDGGYRRRMVAPSTDLRAHPDAPAVGAELAEHYAGCFACGSGEGGLRMRFRVVDELTLESVVTLASHHQGAPGIGHGGIVAAVFDEALGALQVFTQEPAVTANLSTDFRAPVPIGTPLYVRSRLDGRDGRKLRVSASARLGAADGPLAASATGLFVVVPADHFTRHGRPEDVAAARAAGVAPRPFGT